MTGGPIDRYLDELHARLWLPPARIRRVIAESEDHLREAAARYQVGGLMAEEAERRAVVDFGSASIVARRFAAVEGFHLAPSLLLELFMTAVILGGVGMTAIGISGLVAQGMGMGFGKDFVSGNPPGVTYTAERCAQIQPWYPQASDCDAAVVDHHFDETVQYRIVAGVLGVLALTIGLVMRRTYRARAGVHLLPRSLAPSIGAAAFGGAAAMLLLSGLSETIFHVPGAGGLLSGGLVSLVMMGIYTRTLLGSLRTD